MKTTDDKSYYGRVGTKKSKYVLDFVRHHLDIKSVFDAGCNNGNMSYPLQSELGLDVFGVDLSDNLSHPKDYKFEKRDIATSNKITYADCTLFFSLYHHILGKYGLEKADEVFLKLLLRTEYLLFDAGNVSESSRSSTYWYKEQRKHFRTEKELLDHFKIPYEVLGQWSCGGGTRTVVVFRKKDAIKSFYKESTLYRFKGSSSQKKGLTEKVKGVYEGCEFYKVSFLNKDLFCKKRKDSKAEVIEKDNIVKVYEHIDHNKLISFYGYCDEYGLIFEWKENLSYKGKTTLQCGDLKLKDVDIATLGDRELFFDFER